MHRRALFLSLALLLAAPLSARALPAASPGEVGLSRDRLARIGRAMNQQIEAKSFPGAVALVARKGRIAYFETFGQLDPKSGAPMTKDAIFRLYSMTKPFTSVAAMMLVEEGRLRLTDPVGTTCRSWRSWRSRCKALTRTESPRIRSWPPSGR